MTMLSELCTRLQAGKRAPAKQPVPNPGPERLETGMAWETPVVESLYETRSQLSATDAEWREKIYQQLLKVMDLSLLDSLEPADAVWQIREICQRLLDEHAAPVSAAMHFHSPVNRGACCWDRRFPLTQRSMPMTVFGSFLVTRVCRNSRGSRGSSI